ncbi:MAG: DUF790 family protein [Acidobacteriota bacterium]
MLTADLVLARVYRKEVRPRYVRDRDGELLELAAQLIDVFDSHEGRPRHELQGSLDGILGHGTDFQLHRALAKLLFDRCEFEAAAAVEPEELRRGVFAAAAARYQGPDDDSGRPFVFDRGEVLAAAAEELGVEVREVERGLYADLKTEQTLTGWQPCEPNWLLRRYNVALAQGVLLRATELEIQLGTQEPRHHRELFRKIKFFQLMHRVARGKDGGWTVWLDGPASVFKASGRYGLQMASFLPTLLHLDDWELEAKVRWGKPAKDRRFRLAAADGLRSHTRRTGQWQPKELTWLPEQLEALASGWRATTDGELVDLGGEGVLVPDYVFIHEDTGTKVVMEVLGFWRKGAVESRLRLLRRHGPVNLVLGLSSQLAAGRDEALEDLPGEVYLFRTHPIARKLVPVLDRFLA